MYTFSIKETGPELSVTVTRAMLALAAVASLVFGGERQHLTNVLCAVILGGMALFGGLLLRKSGLSKPGILAIAAGILLVATHSVSFAAILLLYGYLARYINQKARIVIDADGVKIQRFLFATKHSWDRFSNIVLKDQLLTLDYINNKLVQVLVEESQTPENEEAFNRYCRDLLRPLVPGAAV